MKSLRTLGVFDYLYMIKKYLVVGFLGFSLVGPLFAEHNGRNSNGRFSSAVSPNKAADDVETCKKYHEDRLNKNVAACYEKYGTSYCYDVCAAHADFYRRFGIERCPTIVGYNFTPNCDE